MNISEFSMVVCDLDGTLCDVVHRQHLAQSGAWDEFHELLERDEVRPHTLYFLKLCIYAGIEVVFLTGRPEPYRSKTERWLEDHCDLFEGDEYVTLLMRGKGQGGSDTIVKQAKLEEFLAEHWPGLTPEQYKESILILDDRDKVVAHFRDLGYTAWQVNEGAF